MRPLFRSPLAFLWASYVPELTRPKNAPYASDGDLSKGNNAADG